MLATDLVGDYVVNVGTDDALTSPALNLRRWRAIEFPTAFGGRKPLLFSDAFDHAAVAHADGDYDWYRPHTDRNPKPFALAPTLTLFLAQVAAAIRQNLRRRRVVERQREQRCARRWTEVCTEVCTEV